MTARRLILLTGASCAIVAATPAHATHEPAPPVPAVSEPVVQPIPDEPDGYEVDTRVEETVYSPYPHHARPAMHHPAPYPHAAPYPAAAMPHHAAAYPMAYPAPHGAYPASRLPENFDREAWLADCREGYRNNRGRRDGAVGGGVLGAAIGGVIGNRVADGDRLAGTLIGAGVGGLAGLAIGQAIGASGDRRRADEACEAWLDRYLAGGHGRHGGHGYPGYGHGYGYGYGYGYGCGCAYTMTYVPVLVAVPQRAVVREKVIEEWVEVPTYTYEEVPTKRVKYRKAPAPKPVKRTKSVKTK